MDVQQVNAQPVQTKTANSPPSEKNEAGGDFLDILGKLQETEQTEPEEENPEENKPKNQESEIRFVLENGILGISPEVIPDTNAAVPDTSPLQEVGSLAGQLEAVPQEEADIAVNSQKDVMAPADNHSDSTVKITTPKAETDAGKAVVIREAVHAETSENGAGEKTDSGKQQSENQSSSQTRQTEVQKAEPRKTEFQKAEAREAEFQKTEVQKTEPQKTEVQKTEPQKTEVQKAEVQKAEVQKSEPQKGQNKNTVKLEELQTKVDSGSYLSHERMARSALLSNIGIQKELQGADPKAVLNQVHTGITQGINKSMEEFTIKLKPEGLGEIIVHMANSGGRILLSIGVSNEETQRMLNSEMMNLKELLRPMDAHVQEIYHNEAGSLDFGAYQQNQFRGQQQMMSARRPEYTDIQEEAEELLMNIQPESIYENGRLNTYI